MRINNTLLRSVRMCSDKNTESLKSAFDYMKKAPLELKMVGLGLYETYLPNKVKAQVLMGGGEHTSKVYLNLNGKIKEFDLQGIWLENWKALKPEKK
jgi:hypothetical protein